MKHLPAVHVLADPTAEDRRMAGYSKGEARESTTNYPERHKESQDSRRRQATYFPERTLKTIK